MTFYSGTFGAELIELRGIQRVRANSCMESGAVTKRDAEEEK